MPIFSVLRCVCCVECVNERRQPLCAGGFQRRAVIGRVIQLTNQRAIGQIAGRDVFGCQARAGDGDKHAIGAAFHAAAQTHAKQLAAPKGDQRVRQLVRLVQRIVFLPRIEIRKKPLAAEF